MPHTFQLDLGRPATPVNARPGEEIILRGSFTSSKTGWVVDAATATWPEGVPGGASTDPGGMIEWEGSGLHMTRRDPGAHEVHAVVTGKKAPACAAAGVSGPCLLLRPLLQARSQLMTNQDWVSSLNGGITVEIPTPPLVAVAPSSVPYLQGAAILAGVGLLAAIGWAVQRRRAQSPAGQLVALATRVRARLRTADPVLAAALTPAVETALASVRRGRVDLASKEGKRVAEALRRVERRIDMAAASEQEQAADDLVRDVESALEAADEVAPARRSM